jgi:thioredoxin 1
MTKESIRTFDEATFDREVLAAPLPVLVEFGATWCGPCKALAPIVHKIAEGRVGRLEVGAIDIDDSPSVATRLGIRGVPTLVLFAGGREVARHVGLTSHAKLAELVDRHIRSDGAGQIAPCVESATG